MTKTTNPRQGRAAARGAILALTAVSALVIGVAGWPDSGVRDEGVPSEEIELARALPTSSFERMQTELTGDLTSFATDVALPLDFRPGDGLASNSVQKAQKKIDKLQAKIAKKEAKIADKQAQQEDADAEVLVQTDALAAAEAQLADAEALPETTAEEVKAKKAALKAANKAVKAATKALKKYQKKSAKLGKQIDKVEAAKDKLEVTVAEIEDGLYGGTGDPDVPGLALPDRMDVMATSSDPQQGGGSAFLPGFPGAGGSSALPDLPPTAQYFTDPKNTYVWDPSTEALDTVNSILCQLQQTAAEAMVNRGPYLAQIDTAGCESGGDTSSGSSSTGQSTSQTEDFEFWTVTSQRADADSTHYVKLWIPNGDGGGDGGDGGDGSGTAGPGGPGGAEPDGMLIHVLITILEPKSELHPFGKFHLDFALADDGDVDHPYFWGTLNTQDALEGFLGFTFFQTTGDAALPYYENRQVHVNMFADGTQGVAHIKEAYAYPSFEPGHEGEVVEESKEYVLAFDDLNLLRAKDDEQPVCLSRTEFDTNVWRYSLYHADGEEAGQRVKLNSGFGIKTADDFHGWAGYWGIWLPNEAQLQSGDTVYEETYGQQGVEPAAYTVFTAPGKLFRNTRQELTLDEIDGMEFEWWYWPAPQGGPGDGGGDPPPPPGPQEPQQPQQLLITYSAGDGGWFKIGEWNNDVGGYDLLEEADWEALDFEQLGVYWLGLWSQSLGGSVNYIPGDDSIISYKEEVVRPGDEAFAEGPLTLYGFTQMLDTGITGDAASTGDVFLDESFDLGSPYAMQFDPSDMTLYMLDDNQELAPVGLADGETYQGGPNDWGMRSGPMLVSTEGMASVFDAWNQDEFYVYETGPNEWNKFIGLLDGEGDSVAFDPPLQFKYTHSTEADLNGDSKWDGKSFLLEYNGPGDLWGLPHDGVDTDGDGYPDRWYPVVNLADGTLMGPTGSEYVVRAWEQEQTLTEDPQGCFELNVDTVKQLPLPDGSTFETPYIGKEPTVDDAPAVVAGEVVAGDA
ncbi:MAG: hypothetical protein H6825_15915 [Planctomycetes bacterium]|nr:hypothetical protein [Planctomycetota bacterium]